MFFHTCRKNYTISFVIVSIIAFYAIFDVHLVHLRIRYFFSGHPNLIFVAYDYIWYSNRHMLKVGKIKEELFSWERTGPTRFVIARLDFWSKPSREANFRFFFGPAFVYLPLDEWTCEERHIPITITGVHGSVQGCKNEASTRSCWKLGMLLRYPLIDNGTNAENVI